MNLYAQIDANNELVQFVCFNTNENGIAHFQANSDCLFLPTEHFGNVEDYRYDEESGEVVYVGGST